VLFKLREEGVAPEAAVITDPDEARRAFERALQTVKDAASEAAALDGPRGRFSPVIGACQRALEGMRFENFLHADRFAALRAAIESEPSLAKQRNGLGDALKALKWNSL